jgi:hypothetical protein
MSVYADTLPVFVELGGVLHGFRKLFVTANSGDTVMVTVDSLPTWPSAAANVPLKVWIADPWDVDKSTDTITTWVTIVPPVLVDLGGDIDICDNQQLILAPAIPLHQYLWHDSTAATFWIADSLNLVSGINTVWLSGSNDRGCTGSDTITIRLLDAPKPKITEFMGFTTAINGVFYNLFCYNWGMEFSCGSFSSYSWSNGSTDSIMVVMPGTWSGTLYDTTLVTVTVTTANGCAATDTSVFFLDICETVPEPVSGIDIYLFPNPLQRGHNASMIIHGYSGDVLLRIFNFLGQEVDKQEFGATDGMVSIVETAHLHRGVYFVQYTSGGHLLHSGRLVVQ